VRQIVPNLEAFGPMTQLFAQQEIVQTGSAQKVEDLFEYLRNNFRVDTVECQNLQM
jgi:hypothetical protein